MLNLTTEEPAVNEPLLIVQFPAIIMESPVAGMYPPDVCTRSPSIESAVRLPPVVKDCADFWTMILLNV